MIMNREMTRKEFLIYLGMLMLTIFGISSFIKNIQSLNPTKNTKKLSETSFGSGVYGV